MCCGWLNMDVTSCVCLGAPKSRDGAAPTGRGVPLQAVRGRRGGYPLGAAEMPKAFQARPSPRQTQEVT